MTNKEAAQMLAITKRIGTVLTRLERTIRERDVLHRRQIAGLELRIANLGAKLKAARRA